MRVNAAKERKSGRRKLLSYVTYAFSSIIFDAVAYTMSLKLSSFLNVSQSLVSTAQGFLFILPQRYLGAYGISLSGFSLTSILLIALPIITFISGIWLHKAATSRRSSDSRSHMPEIHDSG